MSARQHVIGEGRCAPVSATRHQQHFRRIFCLGLTAVVVWATDQCFAAHIQSGSNRAVANEKGVKRQLSASEEQVQPAIKRRAATRRKGADADQVVAGVKRRLSESDEGASGSGLKRQKTALKRQTSVEKKQISELPNRRPRGKEQVEPEEPVEPGDPRGLLNLLNKDFQLFPEIEPKDFKDNHKPMPSRDLEVDMKKVDVSKLPFGTKTHTADAAAITVFQEMEKRSKYNFSYAVVDAAQAAKPLPRIQVSSDADNTGAIIQRNMPVLEWDTLERSMQCKRIVADTKRDRSVDTKSLPKPVVRAQLECKAGICDKVPAEYQSFDFRLASGKWSVKQNAPLSEGDLRVCFKNESNEKKHVMTQHSLLLPPKMAEGFPSYDLVSSMPPGIAAIAKTIFETKQMKKVKTNLVVAELFGTMFNIFKIELLSESKVKDTRHFFGIAEKRKIPNRQLKWTIGVNGDKLDIQPSLISNEQVEVERSEKTTDFGMTFTIPRNPAKGKAKHKGDQWTKNLLGFPDSFIRSYVRPSWIYEYDARLFPVGCFMRFTQPFGSAVLGSPRRGDEYNSSVRVNIRNSKKSFRLTNLGPFSRYLTEEQEKKK